MDKAARMATIIVGVVVGFAALDALESIAAPTVMALVTGVVLSPLSYFWERRGLSPLYGAILGLVGTLVIAAGLLLVFQPVVAHLIEQAPKVWADMRDAVSVVQNLVQGIQEAREEVEKAVAPAADAATQVAEAGRGAAKTSEEGLGLPTVSDALLAAPAVLSRAMIFGGVLFFFLLTRRELYDWVAMQMPGDDERPSASLREAEHLVARYFVTILLINAVLGIATAAMLKVYGMPGALGLGVVAFLLNFILYLGPAVFFCVLIFAGVGTFDGMMVVVPALTFLGFNTIEGQIVTPALVGRHMELNPLLVFLALILGIWLWGPLGGIVAIPVVLWLLVMAGVLPRQFPGTMAEKTTTPGQRAE